MDEKKIAELDAALVQASKKIKVLSTLAWPAGEEEKFLQGWRKGKAQLPEINLEIPAVAKSIEQLDSIVTQCNPNNPVEKFLSETAESYANAGRMLQAIGTTDFTKYSSKIYGRPDMMYKLQGMTAVDGAKFFLDVTDNLLGNQHIQPTETDISATEFAGWLKTEVDEFFEHDTVEVVLDLKMSSKALAGATRIRVRGSAVFSQLDKDQLLYHEAFVHTATQLNGKKQINLKSLGLGAPRTTRTQEGIAVLAELITGAMDITRLRRIALRVIAVKMALDGADFIETFKFFLDAGQSEDESVRSVQRIFRGGAVKGGVVFTKDAVYLQGLLEVHTFLRVAIRDNRPDLVKNLFAGRLTLADALRLSPMFENGWLSPPTYIPTWASDLRRLAATMAYSAFIANIKLDKVYLERAIEMEDELKLVNSQ
ncbi:MAG TPA: flavohemoglobin expression-modulating QEGLA motif protein [Chryseolinea sp.]|nr:flavohemoglobin expression-modulating QEGLA motif protein [Chryseolinea sp.]HPM32103.1 flavohemoglobin expression-modulating QEGLA motif protein [Chryseolinea sp.]